jgi:hypothetical protein
MDRKDIFMSGFKSIYYCLKLGYSFTYKDLTEFETVINFYEQQCEKLKETIDKVIEIIEPLTEFDMCTINGKILKKPLEILKGESE